MRRHWAKALLLTVLGLGGVGVGSRWTVEGAVGIAHSLGTNEVIIGLTIVAVGTSLPEMATSLMAVTRSHSDLAIGNIVGSNIFNILFILGISAAIGPVVIPPGGYHDLLALACFSAVLLPIAITHQRRIVRTEGILLLFGYAAYLLWRTMSKWPV
jgi:cation:H+ antiporter